MSHFFSSGRRPGAFLKAAWATLIFSSFIGFMNGAYPAIDAGDRFSIKVRIFACSVMTLLCMGRFLFGNLWYFSDTYHISDWQLETRRLSRRFAADVVLIMLHITALTCMELSIADIHAFVRALVFLLLTDLWWLAYERNAWPRALLIFLQVRRVLADTTTDIVCVPANTARPEYPPRRWVWNNVGTAVLLVGIDGLARVWDVDGTVLSIGVFIIMTAGNTFIDYHYTRFGML